MTPSDSRADRCQSASLRPLPSPRTGLPRLRVTCLDVLCPLPRWTGPGAFVGCFPKPCCLLHPLAGSASMTSLSRPAQALHTLRPVDSLDRPRRPLSRGFDRDGYPSEPPASYRVNRPLPGWDLHPRGDRAVRGAPEGQRARVGQRDRSGDDAEHVRLLDSWYDTISRSSCSFRSRERVMWASAVHAD
jgi:hypothetical protein